MNLPKPEIGLVINYSYLWHREAEQGHVEGRKDRPCAVILTAKGDRVVVLPITVRGQGFWERLQVRLSESLAHRLIDLKRLDCGIANAVV